MTCTAPCSAPRGAGTVPTADDPVDVAGAVLAAKPVLLAAPIIGPIVTAPVVCIAGYCTVFLSCARSRKFLSSSVELNFFRPKGEEESDMILYGIMWIRTLSDEDNCPSELFE